MPPILPGPPRSLRCEHIPCSPGEQHHGPPPTVNPHTAQDPALLCQETQTPSGLYTHQQELVGSQRKLSEDCTWGRW